jgi:xanthine dehydrogenase YagR molybdenum-binding subunit
MLVVDFYDGQGQSIRNWHQILLPSQTDAPHLRSHDGDRFKSCLRSTSRMPSFERETGSSLSRVEGVDKVTGRLRYVADLSLDSIAHAFLVQAEVSAGLIVDCDLDEASQTEGLLYILTPDNCPKLKELPPELTRDLPCERRPPLSDWVVHYAGQHLALVVAETLEAAQRAASLVCFTYESRDSKLSLSEALHDKTPSHNIGQVQRGVYYPDHFTKLEAEKLQYNRGAEPSVPPDGASIAQTYTTPVEHHNPIETCATIAEWKDDQLTLHDTTRWLLGSRKTIASYLDMPEANVLILCPYLGGAFGSKGFLWQHSVLAAVAARHLNRPVKLVLSRDQMFTSTGHRPATVQQVRLVADAGGNLLSTEHHTLTETSPVAHFVEPAGLHSRNLYVSQHCVISHAVARLNRPTPVFMRAPGEAPGLFALESAMDELAYSLRPAMDPLEFRIRNEAHLDQDGDKPYASKHLLECYEVGASRFGWGERTMEPRSMSRGRLQIGQGMATATYPGRRMAASASAHLSVAGCLTIRVATHELGNGVKTILTQIAADASGLPIERIQVFTGDSSFPEAPYTGASQTTASTGPAVQQAASEIRTRLLEIATDDVASVLYRLPQQHVRMAAGCLMSGNKSEYFMDVLARHGQEIRAQCKAEPSRDMEDRTHQSFGAHFVEVEVDEDIGHVRIVRWVGAYDAGSILNPKLARSQILGGIIFGIGMALMEETGYDNASGRPVNANLGEYHVATQADVPLSIDVTLLNHPDLGLNPLGARGIGELGIVGAPAAIANAIFHATGRRHRHLPIRPEALLG